MHSPFPGMDPYLERRWNDVHASLIHLTKASLQPLLPAALRARSEEQILIEDEMGLRERFEADAVVVEAPREGRASAGTGDIAVVEPIVIEKLAPRHVERWVQIVDVTAGNRVVTAIEFLSPANKRSGPHNRRYLRKVARYLDAGVSLVEVDLLRSSRSRLPVTRDDVPDNARTPYLACIARASQPNRWGIVPIPLRLPLPRIPIPLRAQEPEISLDLQSLIERVYVDGGHDDIDYSRPPKPRLSPEDQAWAKERIRQRAS